VNYERKSFFIPASRLNTGPNEVNNFRIHVEPTPGGQPYWLSRVIAVPFRQPQESRIEAVIYAQNRSWFVIPGPWFNESPVDLLDRFSSSSGTGPAFSREWGDYFSRTAMPALRVPDFNMSSVSQAN
jgi:hypothetical protein